MKLLGVGEGLFVGELFRGGKLIGRFPGKNGVTIQGYNYMLDCMFGAATPVAQKDPWYIGLINNSPTPTLAAADLLSSHAGWAEFTDYTGDRQAWVDADAANRIKGTTTVSEFTITGGGGSLYGIMVASHATSNAGTEILWSTGAFDTVPTVVATDVLRVTYSFQLS